MKNIAIFASGAGSNAENIIKYFQEKKTANVCLVLSNNPTALVLQKAEKLGVSTHIFDKKKFQESTEILALLQKNKVDTLVLAGFLWLIPTTLLVAFPERVINIHPALLPKYGGKGMYGAKVHELVHQNKETSTGITIHYATQHYDEGAIILQVKCELNAQDTPETIAQKVHALEYQYFPITIENCLLQNVSKNEK